MAYSFDGTNDNLQTNTAVVTAVPLTIACWFNVDQDTAKDVLISVGTEGTFFNAFNLVANGAVAGDPLWASTTDGSAESAAATTTGYTVGTWHHACGVFSAVDSRTAYIDGGSSATETTSRTPSGIDDVRMGEYGNSGNDLAGDLAEVAIWNVALTAAEAATLAKGYCPLFVRPASIVAYWPLVRNLSDQIGRFTLTASGAVVAAHPRIIYPRKGQLYPLTTVFDVSTFPHPPQSLPVRQYTEVVAY